MFGINGQEFLIIAAVALLVVGPKDLPAALRFVGQWTGRMQRMRRDLQSQFNKALREAELDGLKKDVEALGKIDPMAGVQQKLVAIESRVGADVASTGPAPKSTAGEAGEPGS